MAIDFGDGDLITTYLHGSQQLTTSSITFDWRLMIQDLLKIRANQEPDSCQIAIKRCRRGPHPVFEGKFVLSGTELFGLNVFYHPIGDFFVELQVRYPDGENGSYRPIYFYPCQDRPRRFMVRRWLGQNYGRVPIECLVDLTQASSIVEHFIKNSGEAWPGVRWLDNSAIQWRFYMGGEDDWHNQAEHLRPVCQVPLPELETLRQLGRLYSDFF